MMQKYHSISVNIVDRPIIGTKHDTNTVHILLLKADLDVIFRLQPITRSNREIQRTEERLQLALKGKAKKSKPSKQENIILGSGFNI